MVQDGEAWFPAMDICDVLGIKWTSDAANLTRIRPEWKRTVVMPDVTVETPRSQEVLAINQKGVFKLAFRSNKPEAEAFTDWLADEVLPALFSQGYYIREMDTLSQQTEWEMRRHREIRWHLRRIELLRREPAPDTEYCSQAEYLKRCRVNTAPQGIGFFGSALPVKARELNQPPIAQPRGSGRKAGTLWPLAVLESCRHLLPPPHPELPFA
jgi:hypothetical protein